MGKDVIVACDFASAEATFKFLDKFAGCARKPFLKIGMELYYAEGPSIVKEIKARGHKIFLDLKLHDIPNTVKKAMAVLSNLDVDITNLHAAGTTAMMKGALEGLTRPDGTRPLLIAVTQLTSTDQEAMERDIEMYGLFTYEDFEDLVPFELYDSFTTKYFKVAIGKGILTWDQLYYYIDRYGPLVN